MKTGRKRGRPRKPADTISSAQFGRAAEVLSIYDRTRSCGEKYSVAIRESIERVRKRKPNRRISRTTVRRDIASLWPKGSTYVVRFEEKVPTADEAAHRAWVREQIAEWRRKEALELGVTIPESWIPDPASPVLSMRFDKLPDYPRYNRKADSE
jgi:hypothetical protein